MLQCAWFDKFTCILQELNALHHHEVTCQNAKFWQTELNMYSVGHSKSSYQVDLIATSHGIICFRYNIGFIFSESLSCPFCPACFPAGFIQFCLAQQYKPIASLYATMQLQFSQLDTDSLDTFHYFLVILLAFVSFLL